MIGYIPSEVIISGGTAILAAIIYLARQISKLGERVARLEGRLNGRPPHDR